MWLIAMSKRIGAIMALALAVTLGSGAAQAADMGQSGAKSFKKSGSNKKPEFNVNQYQDWNVRCPKSDNSQARCEMTQLVKNPNNDKPIMRVIMGYPPKADGAAMIFVTPLGTRLAPGLKLSVDNGKEHRLPFQICLKQGCRADYPIKSTLKRKMKHGSNATVQLVGPRGNKIDLNISLQGFTAANRNLKQ